MNPWPFVIAAYALTLAGVVGLSLWSWATMRREEKRAESYGRIREEGGA